MRVGWGIIRDRRLGTGTWRAKDVETMRARPRLPPEVRRQALVGGPAAACRLERNDGTMGQRPTTSRRAAPGQASRRRLHHHRRHHVPHVLPRRAPTGRSTVLISFNNRSRARLYRGVSCATRYFLINASVSARDIRQSVGRGALR